MGNDLESSVTDWVLDHPETLPVFERSGVDCTCGGKSLEYACRQSGVDPAWFLAELQKVLREGDSPAD